MAYYRQIGEGPFFDDAALFPPGNMPLTDAIPAHHAHRSAWYANMVGPFVFPAPRLGELPAVLGDRPIALSLTVPGGPAVLEAALKEAAEWDAVRLEAVEVVLPPDVTPQRALEALDDHLPDGVLGYLEVPRGERAPAALDALTGTRHRAKFRTGGLTPEAHPDETELAATVVGVVRPGVPFKCTAGLHHAVRHTDGSLEQHGFLNVLLAVDAATRGADAAEVASVLSERSGESVAHRVRELGPDRMSVARKAFVSFGTCSITDPVEDLLGLVALPEERSDR